jgi:hypothetical protein
MELFGAIVEVGILTALSSAVASLWAVVLVDRKRTIAKLDECEQDRKKLWERIGAGEF